MHNRALHDSLAAFVQEAAWQLAEEVSGGAEIPFELDATPTRSAPLYCYRPLTGRFIAQRIGMLSRLPSLPVRRARADRRCPTCRPTCERRGRRVPAGDPRALADSALQAFLGAVWADATDFVFDDDALRGGVRRARGDRLRRLRAVRRDHPRRRAGDRVRRGPARRRAQPGARDDARRRARRPVRRPARDGRRAGARVQGRRARARERRPPPAPAADRAAPVGRRRARARPDGLGAHRRQRRGWPSRSPPACAARPGTACCPPRKRTRCARSAASSPAARRAPASWRGRCGASSSAASAAARSRR